MKVGGARLVEGRDKLPARYRELRGVNYFRRGRSNCRRARVTSAVRSVCPNAALPIVAKGLPHGPGGLYRSMSIAGPDFQTGEPDFHQWNQMAVRLRRVAAVQLAACGAIGRFDSAEHSTTHPFSLTIDP